MTKKIGLIVGLLIPVMLYAERDSLVLKMIKADGTSLLLRDNVLILLEAKDDDLKIEASTYLNLVKDFSFQLEGFENSANQTNKQIRYTNLHGGNYKLIVKAEGCQPQKIEIQVKYTLFEEAWFEYSFLIYLALLVLGMFYIGKIYDNRRKAQIAKIKGKLVADLHDDIGSSLTSIIVFTKLLQRSGLNNNDAQEISQDILDTAQESIDNLRDIVEVLRPTKDNFFDLLEKIKIHSHKLLKSNEIRLNYELLPNSDWQEKLKQKNINIKLNLNTYFIFKEVLNNIIKHAAATVVNISVHKIKDEITIIIKDNGKGFDTSKNYDGFGMSTLRQRAAESHIHFELISALGEGTSITLKIPIV